MFKESTITLGCASDDNYARHAAAMLTSALLSNPHSRFELHYVHGPDFGVQTKDLLHLSLERFGARARLHMHCIPDSWTEGLPLFASMNPGLTRPVMWYRLFLPRLLQQSSRVLYVDSDAIITGDLRPLWTLDLEGKALAAVTQPFPQDIFDWPLKLGLPRREAYFNSGVMLLDLERFRQNGLAEKVLAHGRQHSSFTRYGDQDSLCAELHDERYSLHPRWNLIRAILKLPHARHVFKSHERSAAIRNPAIVHFEGRGKPWIYPKRHPYAYQYHKHARLLPWPALSMPALSRLDRLESFLERRQWLYALQLLQRQRARSAKS